MKLIIENLRTKANRSSTRRNYYSVWRTFNHFYLRLDVKPDSWEERLILFVGHLVNEKKKGGTIRSYICAIKYVLREDGVILNEDKYLLMALTKACRLVNNQVKTRLPIQKGMLALLVKEVGKMFEEKNQPYLSILYRTLFATAYFGLFRVGELTLGEHTVKAKDVHIGENKNKILFVLRSSKAHGKDGKPQSVKIESIPIKHQQRRCAGELEFCPFQLLRDFVMERNTYDFDEEQFFVFRNGSPVTPVQLRKILKLALKRCGFKAHLYNTHSFRAGRGVDLLKAGIKLSVLKKIGRWKSNIVYSYLAYC